MAGPISPNLEVVPATPDELTETGRQVQASGRRWLAIQIDQRDMAAVRQAATQVRQAYGRRRLARPDRDQPERLGERGTCLRAAAGGTGRHGTKFGASYSASKWGVIGLMKSAALELGDHKIRVNALIPGLIDTPLTWREERYRKVIEAGGAQPTGDEAKDEAAAKEARVKQTPLGVPWIEPEDVAPAVVFLASDEARMVSGSTIDVTGGYSAYYT
jgi:NAD(P)-dependent dehydrogenase (short-subunit alcohol dehydrogenase family)